MTLDQWLVVVITFVIIFILSKIFYNDKGEVRPSCKTFVELVGGIFIYFSVFYFTGLLVMLALIGLGVKIEGVNYKTHSTAAAKTEPTTTTTTTTTTTPAPVFIDLPGWGKGGVSENESFCIFYGESEYVSKKGCYGGTTFFQKSAKSFWSGYLYPNHLPLTSYISEVRNYNITIMNFDTFVPTYNWSEDEPLEPSVKVGDLSWSIKVWNFPEEKIHLEVTVRSDDDFYVTSFDELKIVNRDTENVTFKESGFGAEWGHLLVTKDCLEKFLDKEGSLHIMMSFALKGKNRETFRQIKHEKRKVTHSTTKPTKKPMGKILTIPSNNSISSNYSIRGAKLAGEKNGTLHAADATLAY